MAKDAAKSTLPQLEPDYIGGQVFWLVIIFGLLYYVVSKIGLPKLVDVLEHREERIANDLRKAKELQKEAQYLEARFRQEQEAARKKSHSIVEDARKSIEDQIKAAQAKQASDAALAIHKTEQRIEKARQQSMREIQEIVRDIAGNAYEKVSGKSISPSVTETVVKEVLAKEGSA